MTISITATGLVKRYGDLVALDGLDLEVPEGTALGLLGPNGAGKTTAVRILTTLLEPDEGQVAIAGIDVQSDPDEARKKIGLSGQNAAVDEHLTGYENLYIVGRLYGLRSKDARARSRELLEDFALSEAGERPVKTYSGGMRRRLDLAAAIVARPEVLFLDEPTTGLDPHSRNRMWDTIRAMVSDGSTVLLTTQYMDEADQLADDVVVMSEGRQIARGTADELKDSVGGARVELVLKRTDDLAHARRELAQIGLEDIREDSDMRRITAPVPAGQDQLADLLRRLSEDDVSVLDFSLRRPTLDEVFLTLTGSTAESTRDADSDIEAGSSATEKEISA